MQLKKKSMYNWLGAADLRRDTNNMRKQIIFIAQKARIRKDGKFYSADEDKIKHWICRFCDYLNIYYIDDVGMFEEDRDVLKAHLADMLASEFINFADAYTLSYVDVDVVTE